MTAKRYLTILDSETYVETPTGNEIIFLQIREGAEFIAASKEAIDVLAETKVYMVMMPFNSKMFVIGPDTTIMSLLEDHDSAFDDIVELDLAKLYA